MSGPGTPSISTVVSGALVEVSGQPAHAHADPRLPLTDLGVDSLVLLALVEKLQGRLGIVIPDEEIGRMHVLGDVLAVVDRLTADPPPTGRQP